MREIGGYIELDTYKMPMLHDHAVALNSGRNCLAYLIKSKQIRKIKIPYFICESVANLCTRENVQVSYYHIGSDFRPTDICLEEDEWLYFINYYGQIKNDEIQKYIDKYTKVIVDNANAYFQMPLNGTDTIYTCRKWFGVPDGAFLYTDKQLPEELPQDESYGRMHFLLGRYERTASEFYSEYTANNQLFKDEPMKRMSKLTANLLHAIDYQDVYNKRYENFSYLHQHLKSINQLDLNPGTFMYPLLIDDGAAIRKKLQAEKVYIPTLWPYVFMITDRADKEYFMAENILPLPIDQRYSTKDMDYIIQKIENCIRSL